MEPQRRCAACRVRGPKAGLLRFARRPAPPGDGASWQVEIDPPQRGQGRGAYTCPEPRCVERALRRGGLAATLKVGLGPEEAARLATAAVEYLRERSNGGARHVEHSAGIRRSGIPEEEA